MDAIEITWVGGTHEFCLPLGQLRELQQNCDAGPEEVWARLRGGTWRVNDAIEPLRLGLIGAGMSKGDARDLLMPLIDQHALMEFKLAAQTVMVHALLRPEPADTEEDAPGKTEAGETTGDCVSPASTDRAP